MSNALQPTLMLDHESEPNSDLLHHPDHTTYLLQVDGNLSLSSSNSSDSSSEPDHNMFNPDNISTPVPDLNMPHPDNSFTPPPVPGLLDSLNNSPTTTKSASLENISDLENFLPFALSPQGSLSTLDGSRIPRNSPAVDTSQSFHSTPPDGSNILSSSPAADLSVSPHSIPVLVSDPPLQQQRAQRPPQTHQRRVIRRDNRAVTALSLPNIMVTNHRSIFPKFNNLVDELIENEMHLGLHSEIWENCKKIAHTNKIEEAFEIQGIQYVSNPRPNKRGGGAAITLISDSPFTLTKLDPSLLCGDQSVETCWGLLKPKTPTGPIKVIVVCAFYLPPYSKKKSALIEHLSLNYFALKSNHPDSAFICGGDKNDLNTQLLLDIHPSFRQIVSHPTYRQSVLDVLVTDLGQYYEEPVIRPPVQPDCLMTAAPSDHKIVFAKIKSNTMQPVKRAAIFRKVRPLPNQALEGFASWIQRESWEFVYDGNGASDMVERLNFIVNLNLDHFCPTKVQKVTNLDGKISSSAVRQVCRRKNREYDKHGNSERYKKLKKEVKLQLQQATKSFLDRQVALASNRSNSWLKHVKRIAARPGDQSCQTFSLPDHVEQNLSAFESSNKICEFFSAISQEYSPLLIDSLPNRVQHKLTTDPCHHPHLADHTVYEALKKGKKTCSVPGDFPIKIVEEFLPELTAPVAAIFREAITSHTWPSAYKKEYHLPICKVPVPQSEDDLRNLGLTPFLSKRLEWLLINWIWPYVSPHIDPDQLGGLPGCSVTHYLTQMLEFIHNNLDNGSKKPTAVLVGLIDFSKAFNRIDHNVIVTILSDLNVPTCALRLIMSYLSNRRMCVRYNGAVSKEQDIPGGGPQGGLLTVLLFDLQVNLAGNPCPLQPLILPGVTGPAPLPQLEAPLPPCHQKEKTLKKKYVDDLSLLEAVSLRLLIPAIPIIGPLNQHEVPGLILPTHLSVLQHQLSDLCSFTEQNRMKLNLKKSKIMPFNFCKNLDFLPQLHFPGSEPLEVIYETRLLGVIISSDLTWTAHVNYITSSATKKLWTLVRFKSLGATQPQLVAVYLTRVRSILEFAVPVFHSSLTADQSRKIEMVQKKALAIIMDRKYTSYDHVLLQLNLDRLDVRREQLCLSFALKCVNSPKHKSMFPPNPNHRPNMRNPKPYKEQFCNTARYYHSSIPYLARLLNKNSSSKQN